MNKKMEDISVRTNDGLIEISQPDTTVSDVLPIFIHPDQVDLLVKWLHEARDELCKNGFQLIVSGIVIMITRSETNLIGEQMYQWRRFWCPREGYYSLSDEGYLSENVGLSWFDVSE